MKQFYSFENEQGDWTICYGESPDDTESQVICSVDDWHLETVSMLNSIVTEIVNRFADEVRFKTMVCEGENKKQSLSLKLLSHRADSLEKDLNKAIGRACALEEWLTEYRNDLKDTDYRFNRNSTINDINELLNES